MAVGAQIGRNRLMLHAVGVNASLFDATAVLIAMATLSQLPVGQSVGAAAVVLVLGANGVALAAAAGVLLTATGTAGALERPAIDPPRHACGVAHQGEPGRPAGGGHEPRRRSGRS